MNLDILVILALTIILSILSWIIMQEVKLVFGFRKVFLLILHLICILPWFLHYQAFLTSANADMHSMEIYLIPLFLMVFIFLTVNIKNQKAIFCNALIPFLAFFTTRFYIMPTVYEENQNYVFDNIPTIWLFFWTFIATSIVLSYVSSVQFFRLKRRKI